MSRLALVLTFIIGVSLVPPGPAVADEHENRTGSATVLVTLETAAGDIQLEIYPGRAPVTAGNFLRYVDGGHYNGAIFYRVVRLSNDNGSPKIEVIQGGLGDAEPPFPPIAHETTEVTGLLHENGVISMARGDPGTASSEFFITIGDQPALDFGATRNPDQQGFATFGRVADGMDIVRAIQAMPSDTPVEGAYYVGQILEEPVVMIRVYRAEE